jgi:hypothetical protein
MAVALYAVLLTPCFAGKPKTFVGTDINFANYHTYSWFPTKILTASGIVEDDPKVGPAIRSAINTELTARGLKEVPEGGDLQVATIVLTQPVPQLEGVIFPGGVDMDFATPIATMGRYNREGTLGVNLIDSHTKKFAWVGMITESIDTKQGANIKKIAPAARKLFNKFPMAKVKK